MAKTVLAHSFLELTLKIKAMAKVPLFLWYSK